MLRVATGAGLGQFMLHHLVAERPDPVQWPILTLSFDQGSDGYCAANFVAYHLPVGILALPDPNHRCWNDAQLALKDCKMWSAINVMTIVFNADRGPWADARWYQQAKESVSTYITLTRPESCPVWALLFEKIAAERGELHRQAEEGYSQEAFRKLENAWHFMSQKIGMSRWFGWTDSDIPFRRCGMLGCWC